jgi:hypothetical protein
VLIEIAVAFVSGAGFGGGLSRLLYRRRVQRERERENAKAEKRSSKKKTPSDTLVDWLVRGALGEKDVFNTQCPACKTQWFWHQGTPDSCSCDKHDVLHFHLACQGASKFGCGYEWAMKAATTPFMVPNVPYRTQASVDAVDDVPVSSSKLKTGA